MAWPKGKPRPPNSGRAKGTPNRVTKTLEEMCEAKGVNIFELMLEFVTTPCDRNLRLAALKEIAQYLYPKRKALEITGQIEGIVVNVYDYTDKKK